MHKHQIKDSAFDTNKGEEERERERMWQRCNYSRWLTHKFETILSEIYVCVNERVQI